jgi:HSP20 family protein
MIGIQVAPFSFIPSAESRDLADDVRELFADLAATLNYEHRAFSGECHPAVDVRETDDRLEIVVDVPGVPPDALRVLFRGGVVIVAGEKAPVASHDEQTYHLVEREFGRFARAIRVTGAFDVERARASVEKGELVVLLPKLAERRGRAHRIRVTADGREPA